MQDLRNHTRGKQAFGIGVTACGAIVGGVFAGPAGVFVGASLGLLVLPAKQRAQIVKGLQARDDAVLPDNAVLLDNAVATGVTKFDVQIPAEAMEWREGILFFGVEVVPVEGGDPWRVMKRYSDFYNLNQYLQQVDQSVPSLTSVDKQPWLFLGSHGVFPRKHLRECKGARLELRRQRLEAWLQKVVRRKHLSWAVPVRGFLHSSPCAGTAALLSELEACPSEARSVQASPGLPTTLEMTSLTQSPKPRSFVSFQGPGVTLQIQIPKGVCAGQSVPIVVPGGREINFMLPSDAAGGSSLRLWYDRATRALTIME